MWNSDLTHITEDRRLGYLIVLKKEEWARPEKEVRALLKFKFECAEESIIAKIEEAINKE